MPKRSARGPGHFSVTQQGDRGEFASRGLRGFEPLLAPCPIRAQRTASAEQQRPLAVRPPEQLGHGWARFPSWTCEFDSRRPLHPRNRRSRPQPKPTALPSFQGRRPCRARFVPDYDAGAALPPESLGPPFFISARPRTGSLPKLDKRVRFSSTASPLWWIPGEPMAWWTGADLRVPHGLAWRREPDRSLRHHAVHDPAVVGSLVLTRGTVAACAMKATTANQRHHVERHLHHGRHLPRDHGATRRSSRPRRTTDEPCDERTPRRAS